MNDTHTQSNLTCTDCGYLLDGLNLSENCPECGKQIVNDCFWCEYDLTNTAPDSNCPECGVPVTASIGHGVLAFVPLKKLRAIHSGLKTITMLILLYIVIAIVASVAMFGVLSASWSNTSVHVAVVTTAFITNAIILIILHGWWKVSQPLTEIPNSIDAQDMRSFLRVMLVVIAVFTGISFLLALVPQNHDPMAPWTTLDLITLILNLIGAIIYLITFIAQVRYIGWIAKLVRNKKMYRRSKHLVWSGPIIAIIGAFLVMLGPLIVLILYWNMIEYTRRDLKKIIKTAHESGLANT